MPDIIPTFSAILGRLLLGAIFAVSPLVNLIPNFGKTVDAMHGADIPFAAPALVVAIAMLLVGSMLLIAGYKARYGALLLLLFLIPATYYFHAPWKAHDAAEAGQQVIHFLKNIALLGAMLLVMVLGSGPGSLDGARR
jgi:putative oxidoreductase